MSYTNQSPYPKSEARLKWLGSKERESGLYNISRPDYYPLWCVFPPLFKRSEKNVVVGGGEMFHQLGEEKKVSEIRTNKSFPFLLVFFSFPNEWKVGQTAFSTYIQRVVHLFHSTNKNYVEHNCCFSFFFSVFKNSNFERKKRKFSDLVSAGCLFLIIAS